MSWEINSNVDIVNLALDQIGEKPIANISTPETEQEKICARWFTLCNEMLLRDGNFSFATKRAKLAKSTTLPVFGKETLFQKPADYLNLLSIATGTTWLNVSRKIGYRVEGEFLLIEQIFVEDYLPIRYVSNNVNVTKMDVNYIGALIFYLAYHLAYKFKRSQNEREALKQEFKDKYAIAMAVAGRESPIQIIHSTTLYKNIPDTEYDIRWQD